MQASSLAPRHQRKEHGQARPARLRSPHHHESGLRGGRDVQDFFQPSITYAGHECSGQVAKATSLVLRVVLHNIVLSFSKNYERAISLMTQAAA